MSLFHIPDSHIGIRIFPADTDPRNGMYYLDFYDTVDHKPINSPHGFQIHAVSPSTILGPAGPLMFCLCVCP